MEATNKYSFVLFLCVCTLNLASDFFFLKKFLILSAVDIIIFRVNHLYPWRMLKW